MCLTRNLSFRRAIYLFIFRAFIFYLSVFFLHRSSVETTLTVKVVLVSSVSRRVDVSPIVFDSEAYYRPSSRITSFVR